MTEPNARPFTASVTYDLATYKETDIAYQRFFLRNSFAYLFVVAFMVYLFNAFLPHNKIFLSQMLILFWSIFWGSSLFRHFRNKNGSKSYKQMLASNNGMPTHLEYTFLADGIHIHNTCTNGISIIPYGQIRNVFETDNLIVLVQEHQLMIPVSKDSICGGPVCAFSQKLLQAATSVKRKKVKTLLPGKLIHGAFVAFSVCCILAGLLWSPPAQNIRDTHRAINNTMDFRQIADELEPLGIRNIPDDVFRDLSEAEFMYGPSLYYDSTGKCLSLLTLAGMGTYDEDTWAWTPSRCGVFWFDSEAFDLEHMYTNLLLGISALDPDTLCFTDIQEDTSNVDWMNGTGSQKVIFHWNDQSYTLYASVDYDWYDLTFLSQLNNVMLTETDGKQLYFAWDQGQGLLVFFGDKQWASRFESATGIALYTDPIYTGAIY